MRLSPLFLFFGVASAMETLQLLHPHEDFAQDIVATSDANLEHYGHPPDGCDSDEKAFQIQGVPGMVRRSGIVRVSVLLLADPLLHTFFLWAGLRPNLRSFGRLPW